MNVAQMTLRTLILTMLPGLAVIGSNRAEAAGSEDVSAAAFGTPEGIDYLLDLGRFVGETLTGTCRMTFEIGALADHFVIVTRRNEYVQLSSISRPSFDAVTRTFGRRYFLRFRDFPHAVCQRGWQ